MQRTTESDGGSSEEMDKLEWVEGSTQDNLKDGKGKEGRRGK